MHLAFNGKAAWVSSLWLNYMYFTFCKTALEILALIILSLLILKTHCTGVLNLKWNNPKCFTVCAKRNCFCKLCFSSGLRFTVRYFFSFPVGWWKTTRVPGELHAAVVLPGAIVSLAAPDNHSVCRTTPAVVWNYRCPTTKWFCEYSYRKIRKIPPSFHYFGTTICQYTVS